MKTSRNPYSIKDHLGNVRVTFADVKIPANGQLLDFYTETQSVSTYYPFGWEVKPLSWAVETFAFGYQGQIKDDELKGKSVMLNYKYRAYDSRVARFFAVDPLAAKYPWNSSYAFSENKVIRYKELEGSEVNDPMLNDEFFMSKLILTNFYDVKHSIINSFTYVVWRFKPGFSPKRTKAVYATDENGNEIFKTQYITTKESKFDITQHIEGALDNLNVYGGGKFDATDVLSMKTDKTKITREAKKLIGEGAPIIESKTIFKKKGSKSRIDIENPAPGKRPGQLHFQNTQNEKFMFDFEKNKFFKKSPETGMYDIDVTKNVYKELGENNVKNAIKKGKYYLDID